MDQIHCEAAQTFLLAQGKQQEGAGTWERQKKQQRDLAGLLALDNSKCSWNYHIMWNCYIPRDCLNIGIKKYSMTSCTCPSHRKTRGFSVLWWLEIPMCRNPAFGNVWWYQAEGGFTEFSVLDWQSLTGIPRGSISVQDISRNPACQRANILKIILTAAIWTPKNESRQRFSTLKKEEGLFSSQSFHQLTKIALKLLFFFQFSAQQAACYVCPCYLYPP